MLHSDTRALFVVGVAQHIADNTPDVEGAAIRGRGSASRWKRGKVDDPWPSLTKRREGGGGSAADTKELTMTKPT